MKKILFTIILISCFIFNIDDVNAAIIADGTYKIQSALASNKVLDVQNADAFNGTNIQLYDYNESDGQKWNVKQLSNGYFLITSALDDKMSLDVAGASTVKGANVQLYTSNNTNAQQWLIKYAGDGYYYIMSKCNGYYIDVAGGNILNGANIHMYTGNGTMAQKFKFIEIIDNTQTIEDGTYTISTALNSDRVIDVNDANTNNWTNVQLYDNLETWGQIWNIKYLNDGYYSITTFLDENKSLDVMNGSFKNGANVQIYDSNGSSAQRWIIKDAGNGYYNIVSQIDNMYVDVYNGSSSNKTNIQLYHGNGSYAQKFKFNKIKANKLQDGLYTINSLLDQNKTVSVKTEVAINQANVLLKTSNDLNSQKWYVKHIGKGYYTLTSALGSNKVLDVSSANKANGANVQIYSSNNTSAQKWYIKYNSDDSYSLVAQHSGLYLDVANASTADGTNIQTYQKNNSNAQKFIFKEATLNSYQRSYEDGYYNVYSALDLSKSLDVYGAKKINGTNIQLYQNNSELAQLWYFKYLDNGYYSITSAMNPKTSLDVAGGGMVNGTNVQLYKTNGSDSQQWLLKDLGDGYVSIVSKQNSLYLDVASASTANYTNIQMYEGNNTTAQKFKLVKNTSKKVYTGIDVSKHQGNIDWNTVANLNLGFVIIRAGYGDDLTNQDDEQFKANVAACEKYNIPYGIYLYSYAKYAGTSEESAASEANHILRLIREIGANNYKPNLGTKVFLDIEDKSVISSGKDVLTDVANTFCSTIEANGYSCGIYANKTWLTDNLDASFLAQKYDIWLAEWPNNITSHWQAKNYTPSYNLTPYKYWQFTSNGSIAGINTRVDLDLGYDIFD